MIYELAGTYRIITATWDKQNPKVMSKSLRLRFHHNTGITEDALPSRL